MIIPKLTLLRWVHNIPSMNNLSGQKSIKFLGGILESQKDIMKLTDLYRVSKEWRTCKSFELAQTPCLWLAISSCMQAIMLLPKVYFCLGIIFWRISYHYLKSRFFKNSKLYRPNLPQNSNLGRESFVQKSGVQISVGGGSNFWLFLLSIKKN